MSSTLHQLLALMRTSLATLEAVCAESGTKIPDLDEPFTRASENFRTDARAARAANVLAAAAAQISAIVLPPTATLFQFIHGVSAVTTGPRFLLTKNLVRSPVELPLSALVLSVWTIHRAIPAIRLTTFEANVSEILREAGPKVVRLSLRHQLKLTTS